MTVLSHTQAVLLLTAYFSKPETGDPKPLTPKEWGRFALWLKENSLKPEALMTGDLKLLLDGWKDKNITLDRIEQLINRGSALALGMEKWLRAGLWVITRSDGDYPVRLKQRLKTDSPAVLFGCGNPKLLNHGGVAVVGSRNATNEDLAFARRLGRLAAAQSLSIVSGGARGIDESSMLGALEAEGSVVGVLADSLLRAATSAKYRKYLMSNDLTLLSPFYPEAGFSPVNAMARNKYIYCLSDAAVIVHSGTDGGTWSGALENLKHDWVPLWVNKTKDTESGNQQIVAKGGTWIAGKLEELSFASLFAQGADMPKGKSEGQKSPNDTGFYELFLLKIEVLCQHEAKTSEELVRKLEINKTQLNVWLKRAVAEKRLKRITKPVRYQWQQQGFHQIKMFGE